MTWKAPSLDAGNGTQGTIFQNRLSERGGGQVKAEGGGDTHGCTLESTHKKKKCSMVTEVVRRITYGLVHCQAESTSTQIIINLNVLLQ